MKKLASLLILLSISGVAMADTYTAKFGLTKPTRASYNWDGKINGNFDIIDAYVPKLDLYNVFTGSITALGFYGSGAGLTGVITSTSALQNDINSRLPLTGGTISGSLNVTNSVTAAYLYGNGSGITGLTAVGDNLGNHTATTTISMGGNNISNAGKVLVGTTTATDLLTLYRRTGLFTGITLQQDSILGNTDWSPFISFKTGSHKNWAIGTTFNNLRFVNVTDSKEVSIDENGVVTAPYFSGDGSLLTNIPSGGDNLGSHIATQTIVAPYGISASTFAAYGSSVTVSSMSLLCLNGGCYDALPVAQSDSQYFLTNTTSDVNGYNLFIPTVPIGVPASTATVTLTGSDQLVASYITPIGYPGLTYIPEGIWRFHFNASVSNAGSAYYQTSGYAKIYTYLNGVKTFVANSDLSTTLTVYPQSTGRTIDSNVQQIVMSTGTRLMIDWYAKSIGNGPQYPTLYIYRGNDYFNSVRFPIVTNSGSFVTYRTATQDVDLNGHKLTANSITSSNAIITSSDVVAHAYYGDGSHLTNLGGGGDVFKASTQTFTGSNTFTGSVTVSSLTVLNRLNISSSTVFPSSSLSITPTAAGTCVSGSTISVNVPYTTNVMLSISNYCLDGQSGFNLSWGFRRDGASINYGGSSASGVGASFYRNNSFMFIDENVPAGTRSYCVEFYKSGGTFTLQTGKFQAQVIP